MYLFLDGKNRVLYVGKAKDLKKRVSSYFRNVQLLGEKTKLLVREQRKIKIVLVESELEALLLEANFVKKYKPTFNVRLLDGKAYPLIRITQKDTYPKVLTSRREDDNSSIYFGPYPNAGALRTVLKIIRRIFPFQAVMHHPKRPCLYYHINLCPCPPAFDSPALKKTYRRNIRHIIQFLNGKKEQVIKELERERDQLSNIEQFEEARMLQKQIDAILLITSPVHQPFEYEINPNLRHDMRSKELENLQETLEHFGTKVERLARIECFDISNISGTNATGSMVVFTNGEKDASQYRRFKIRFLALPNDFAMIHEVLQRRIIHREWKLPDLIIVDGGKGQVSSALKALRETNITIPVVGLAKREEIIITSDFTEIKLTKDSGALHLVQRIRDEAHRFAVTYHRKLRGHDMFEK